MWASSTGELASSTEKLCFPSPWIRRTLLLALRCHVCGFETDGRLLFRAHMTEHRQQERGSFSLHCCVCDHATNQEAAMRAHADKHVLGGATRCDATVACFGDIAQGRAICCEKLLNYMIKGGLHPTFYFCTNVFTVCAPTPAVDSRGRYCPLLRMDENWSIRSYCTMQYESEYRASSNGGTYNLFLKKNGVVLF